MPPGMAQASAMGGKAQRMPSLGNETTAAPRRPSPRWMVGRSSAAAPTLAKGLASWDASIGFSKDQDGFVVCNVCGTRQGQAIVETDHVSLRRRVQLMVMYQPPTEMLPPAKRPKLRRSPLAVLRQLQAGAH